MSRCIFVDPVSGVGYKWHQNHSEETESRRTRPVHELPSVAVGWSTAGRTTRQQGLRSAHILRLEGNIPAVEQHRQFIRFQTRCLTQTIYFYHPDGRQWEALIVSYEPRRRRVVRSARGEKYIWEYILELDLIRRL